MKDTFKSKIDLLRLDIDSISKDIVEKQYLLQPEFEKYGVRGMQHSLNDSKYNLEYLFSAMEVNSVLLFRRYNQWANQLFNNLNLPPDTLEKFYVCTKEVFDERLQSGMIVTEMYNKLIEYIDVGIEALISEANEPTTVGQVDNPMSEVLQKYTHFVLSGDKNAATKYMMDVSRTGAEIKDIYKHVIQPFQLELGRLWHENRISVGYEHFATAVSQSAMAVLYVRIFSVPKNEKVFMGTCVEGELHEFGIRMICDFMESEGWNTYYLGANMPDRGIIQMINEKNPDIIAISCTMTFNVSKVKRLIEAIRSLDKKRHIIVGGYSFNLDRSLWKKIGADAFSEDFEAAHTISENLYYRGKTDVI